VALKVMSLFPLPTPNMANALRLYNNWIASGATPSNSNDQFDLRIDHRFNEKNLLSAKVLPRHGTPIPPLIASRR
jgi:hypothetical protein